MMPVIKLDAQPALVRDASRWWALSLEVVEPGGAAGQRQMARAPLLSSLGAKQFVVGYARPAKSGRKLPGGFRAEVRASGQPLLLDCAADGELLGASSDACCVRYVQAVLQHLKASHDIARNGQNDGELRACEFAQRSLTTSSYLSLASGGDPRRGREARRQDANAADPPKNVEPAKGERCRTECSGPGAGEARSGTEIAVNAFRAGSRHVYPLSRTLAAEEIASCPHFRQRSFPANLYADRTLIG